MNQAKMSGGNGQTSQSSNLTKLKRKAASDLSVTNKKSKKQSKGLQATTSMVTNSASTNNQDDKTSQSSMYLSKSNKTAAVIAAAEAAKAKAAAKVSSTDEAASSSKPESSTTSNTTLILNENEVKRYLLRKPMTCKELVQKFRSKTQNTMTNQQLMERLHTILEKLNAKTIDMNGFKYLSLS
jgi:transcription initiation factor TFIIF subunit alpha